MGVFLSTSKAAAQQPSIKEQLVGTWMFVSLVRVRPDGSRFDPYGQNPKGIWMFDANGNFAQLLMRSDIPKFAANNREQGTPEENKAVVQGSISTYGTYSVNETDRVINVHIVGSSYPNSNGADGRRIIISLTGDELKVRDPANSTGVTVEATWKRPR
jgi:hypothetical protein